MLAIVGKATPNDQTGDIELFLRQFAEMHGRNGQFVYAWSFNPDPVAIDHLRQSCNRHKDVYLYLHEKHGLSTLRMRVVDFHHERSAYGTECPNEWIDYCIEDLRGLQAFRTDPPGAKPIHIWFLIDRIEHLTKPVNLRAFSPVFPKYRNWGQNYFAFLHIV